MYRGKEKNISLPLTATLYREREMKCYKPNQNRKSRNSHLIEGERGKAKSFDTNIVIRSDLLQWPMYRGKENNID